MEKITLLALANEYNEKVKDYVYTELKKAIYNKIKSLYSVKAVITLDDAEKPVIRIGAFDSYEVVIDESKMGFVPMSKADKVSVTITNRKGKVETFKISIFKEGEFEYIGGQILWACIADYGITRV